GVITAVPFAKAAYECGVKAIAVHARFAGQGHGGTADWDVIKQVKEAVPELPVLGNGDVKTPQDAKRMLDETGCDGAMVGRAALGHPWLFGQMAYYLETGELLPDPTRSERAALALEHARRTREHSWMPERKIVLELRGQLSKYQLNDPGTMHIRNRLVRVESFAEVEAILLEVIEQG
ncbi:MAG: tRNA dihydrouridine synthase, partial [Aggregatilineales bacterium]